MSVSFVTLLNYFKFGSDVFLHDLFVTCLG